ncbi:flagellar hook-associated protein FlgK [Desulfovibrio sp. X2]|uniref:flagellar hook-associated protein FlgK n=1 Tax=Desulfovibrio sp. X2 TaxID=941449 RepID=UPI000358EC9E|nr:flagellar hook-associated protein FlgK [Desulfovibrio sp. X2]EPR41622.1 flagellar hook-associated protein FlgK [Desulfovibrio sp. X2]
MDNLLSIARNALMNSQYAITVHGNNISNESVDGYRVRTVNYSELPSVSTSKGQVGTGATIGSVTRHLNQYLEAQYLKENSQASGWQTRYDALSQVESRFVEDDTYGTSALLDDFWNSWADLSDDPTLTANRTALLTTSETLTTRLNDLSADLATQQQELDQQIAQEVGETNDIIDQLATVNKQIAASPDSDDLLDSRDSLLRQLSEKVDVQVMYRSDGEVYVTTGAGQSLVDGATAYRFEIQAPHAAEALTQDSDFAGQINFEGSSPYEYTVEVVDGGTASGGSGAAAFRVSVDGGSTWLTNDDGTEKLFTAGAEDDSVDIGGVTVWFSQSGDPDSAETSSLSAGDRFTILPKNTLAWETTAGGLVNVTPLDDEGSGNRISGGTLAGLFRARDQVGEYSEDLDSFAKTLIWEVNRQNSQGAGLDPQTSATGIYQAAHTDVPLSQSGLAFADRVTSGAFSLALYDSTTGEPLGTTTVDFSSINPPGISTFDPAQHSLDDVAAAINDSFGGQLTADVTNGKLSIEAADGVSFNFADDSSGLFAAAGLNCYFSGTDAGDIAVNQNLQDHPELIAAGHVNGEGEANQGDNTTAQAIVNLADKDVTFYTARGSTTSTLGENLAGVVSQVGSDVSQAETQYSYASTLADSLDTQQESASGVNSDEEMTEMLRLQQDYQAASRMIQVSLDMMDTILGLK